MQNFVAHFKQLSIARRQFQMSANAIALYYSLLEYDNDLSWIDNFTAPNGVLEANAGLSKDALIRARNELSQKGLVAYNKGSTRQCGSYTIIDYSCVTTNPATNPATNPLPILQPLTKPNENQTKPEVDANASCAELPQSGTPRGKVAISIPLNDGSEFPIYDSQVDEWKTLFPAVAVEQQLREMKAWSDANKSKRKTKSGILRFVVAWLSKKQNQGGDNNGNTRQNDGFSPSTGFKR
jgi:hypothetical protein